MNRVVLMGQRLWAGWKKIAAKIAHVQGHLLLSVIYGVIVAPLAGLFTLAGQDPLAVKLKRSTSFWVKRLSVRPVSESLKKEY